MVSEEEMEVGRAYARQSIQVEDLAYAAKGKAASAAAAAKPAKAAKKSVKKAGKPQAPEPAHSAQDRLDAAIRERNEKGWLFCGNNMELERALESAADKERRANRDATRAYQAAAAPAPQYTREEIRKHDEAKAEERLAGATAKLKEAEGRLSAKTTQLRKLRGERNTSDDPFRVAELKSAIAVLIEDLLPRLDVEVKLARENVQMAQINVPKVPEPMTELQQREEAWRATQRIGR